MKFFILSAVFCIGYIWNLLLYYSVAYIRIIFIMQNFSTSITSIRESKISKIFNCFIQNDTICPGLDNHNTYHTNISIHYTYLQ